MQMADIHAAMQMFAFSSICGEDCAVADPRSPCDPAVLFFYAPPHSRPSPTPRRSVGEARLLQVPEAVLDGGLPGGGGPCRQVESCFVALKAALHA